MHLRDEASNQIAWQRARQRHREGGYVAREQVAHLVPKRAQRRFDERQDDGIARPLGQPQVPAVSERPQVRQLAVQQGALGKLRFQIGGNGAQQRRIGDDDGAALAGGLDERFGRGEPLRYGLVADQEIGHSHRERIFGPVQFPVRAGHQHGVEQQAVRSQIAVLVAQLEDVSADIGQHGRARHERAVAAVGQDMDWARTVMPSTAECLGDVRVLAFGRDQEDGTRRGERWIADDLQRRRWPRYAAGICLVQIAEQGCDRERPARPYADDARLAGAGDGAFQPRYVLAHRPRICLGQLVEFGLVAVRRHRRRKA